MLATAYEAIRQSKGFRIVLGTRARYDIALCYEEIGFHFLPLSSSSVPQLPALAHNATPGPRKSFDSPPSAELGQRRGSNNTY